ncbi:MAG: radical SAM protein [Methanoculleus sp. SDB]|nr:MAG: radical SAM protein [Methanoculleus sp. SDB]
MKSNEPSYRALLHTGELRERILQAYRILSSCTLCPRKCHVDRLSGKKGYCRSGLLPAVASAGPHFGEEPPLVGRAGSGTIFFTHCTMRCAFCQNYPISQEGYGREISCGELATHMLSLQEKGCHNINLVSPTHYIPQIMEATAIAAAKGLKIPLVFNTGGYDRPETLELLDGIVDIYMPDAKYGDNTSARTLSDAPDYVEAMQSAIREMHRQVGDLVTDDNGIALHGLLIRHLVLPGNIARSDRVMAFIATEISVHSYVNIMDQYLPCGRICSPGFDARLHRPVTAREYAFAIRCARENGLYRGFIGK